MQHRFAHGAENKEGQDVEEVSGQCPEVMTGDRADEVEILDPVVSKCCGCSVPWDKFRGKRRCPVCGVPLLLCPDCLKAPEKKDAICFLCQEDKSQGRQKFDKRKHFNDLVLGDCDKLDSNGKRALPAAMTTNKRIRGIHTCGVCEEVFTSRNALFRHINETGHANRKSKKRKVA